MVSVLLRLRSSGILEEYPNVAAYVGNDAISVRQLDDTHLHWKASFGGKEHEWDAEITEQVPDDRIAWRATDGKTNAGVVTFHKLDDDRTKIMLQLDWDPEGMLEALGGAIGSDDRRVSGDLERFKELIESRGAESGAFRGEVKQSS